MATTTREENPSSSPSTEEEEGEEVIEGFLFLEGCDVNCLIQQETEEETQNLNNYSKCPGSTFSKNRWLDLKYQQVKKNGSSSVFCERHEDSSFSGCSSWDLLLHPSIDQKSEESEDVQCCWTLMGIPPRFDGTINDTKPDKTHCTCPNCNKHENSNKKKQQQQQQRSDATLLLGLALSCEEMGHIRIQSAQIMMFDQDDEEEDIIMSVSPTPAESKATTTMTTTQQHVIQRKKAAIFISFSLPEIFTRTKRKQKSLSSSRRRRFISNSSKPLPPSTQLLLSLMRSDWDNVDMFLQHPEKLIIQQQQNSSSSTKRKGTGRQRQQLSLFPAKLSLEEVYKRIGGAASVIDDYDEMMEYNVSITISSSSSVSSPEEHYTLQSLPNDILLDHISAFLRAKSLEALRCTCKKLHFRLREVVPGLKLRLYAHQIKSLSWMRQRETKALLESDFACDNGIDTNEDTIDNVTDKKGQPKGKVNSSIIKTEHDFHRAASGGASVLLNVRNEKSQMTNSNIRISQYTGDEIHIRSDDPLARKVARGGMLCDDPGLGKTITVISLILQTLGLSTILQQQSVPENNTDNGNGDGTTGQPVEMTGEEKIFQEYWKDNVPETFRYQALAKMIKSFIRRNRDAADYFYWPVDPIQDGCPDYFDVIKSPMCFQDIERQIEKGEYGESFLAFQKDALLCFRNAMEYNAEDSKYYQAAKRMREVFLQSVESFKAKQVQSAQKSFGRASSKPNSAVAALVEEHKTLKFKSALVPSSATLLVVPSVLLEHWEAQIRLHVDVKFCTNLEPIVFEYSGTAQSGLQMEKILNQCLVKKTHYPFVFIDKTSTKKLPSPDFLAMFSIVITTNQRFTNEWENGSFQDQLDRESKSSSRDTHRVNYVYDTLGQSEEEACTLLKVNWLRMIVDEGHSMGRGRNNSAILFASWIEAERRWVMTGTPHRSSQSGLSNIMNLVAYLKHDFFSPRQDGAAVWQNLIARGWNKGLLCSFYRLRSLLKLLMVRHTKLDIEELQPPRYETTTLQMSPDEVRTYNTLVCGVHQNLIITSMKGGKTKGVQDSLLHRSQGKYAKEAMGNVQLVCCGGTQVRPTLSGQFWNEFLHDLALCNPGSDKMEEVKGFLSRATVTNELSPCGCCGIMLPTLLVFPCGDLVCTECVDPNDNVCVVCGDRFDVDVFQRLQPGFVYNWLHNIEEEAKKLKAKVTVHPPDAGEEIQEDRVEILEGGAGMLAPIDESEQQQRRRRTRKPGDGHVCKYCPKRADGRCLLCWAPHDACNFVSNGGKCEVCHLKYESCPISETKPRYVINRLLELSQMNQKSKDRRRPISESILTEEGNAGLNDIRPLKVIVFSQFRKTLNTVGDRLLRRLGTACVAEYWGKYRKRELARFVHDEECFCMLLGKDGSEGLDLSFVTNIIFLEKTNDKALQQQAVSRAYRMGAKGSVHVETLIAANTVEETMLRLETGMLEGEHNNDNNNAEIQTIQSETLSNMDDKDYQRAKLHFLLKSLKLIANSFSTSFGTVTKRPAVALKASANDSASDPPIKKRRKNTSTAEKKLHVHFAENIFK